MIAIIDYGVGNLFSLQSSFSMIGAEAAVTGDPEVIRSADRLILPGVAISLDSMIARTSLLPNISLADGPKGLVGTNTNDCIVNGVIYGNSAILDGLTERLTEELEEEPTVIVTGDMADRIVPYCRKNMIIDQNLLLKGLRIIYLRNAV